MSDDCKVCGEEGGAAEGYLGCKFNGCVHYVDQLEKVLLLVERHTDWAALIPLKHAVAKAREMGKTYGRPLEWKNI